MANIKDLKKKIKTTKGMLKITSAMKLVSASKFAKAQQAVQNARLYAAGLEGTVRDVLAFHGDRAHPCLGEPAGDGGAATLLVVSADKGLCGGYNALLAKKARSFLDGRPGAVPRFIGRKARDLLASGGPDGELLGFDKAAPAFREVKGLADGLRADFEERGTEAFVAWNEFHSAMSFTPSVRRLLPMPLEDGPPPERPPFDFLYDPGPGDVLDALVPEAVVMSLWTRVLEALASEHGSRMAAMDSAATNCREAIRKQTITMNKLRQAAITTELIEVVSGAESLAS